MMVLNDHEGQGSGRCIRVGMVSEREIIGSRQLSSFTFTIPLLSASHQLAPANAVDWFDKGRARC